MPPKQQQPSKKAEQKRKEKIIEDKTFGLKNKKGNKNQKFVQQIQNQMRNQDPRAKNAQKAKEKERDDMLDLNKLLKPVEQKVAKDVDPKSMLCLFFKQGMCTKGNKCKFSHDLGVEHKVQKRNLYADSRDIEKEADTMENWDEDKLKEVVNKKQTEANRNQTTIVCKYFLQAVEECKYGWFWECPNGGDKCIYRHALPEGYVLKRDRKKMEEQKEDEISLEELIEKERSALSSKNLTKITLQSFVAWKKKKLREKKEKEEAELKAKRDKIKAGKALGMSGRDLFTFNADMIADDDEADDGLYERDEDENVDPDEKIFEIDANFFKFEGMEDDDEEEPTVGTSLEDGVAKMTVNEELFDVDEIEGLDSDDDEPAGAS